MSAPTFGRRPAATDRPHLRAVPALAAAQPATAEPTPTLGPSAQPPSGTAPSPREALFALLRARDETTSCRYGVSRGTSS